MGTFSGGEDIKPYREMKSSPTMVAEVLHSGCEVFFTIRITDDDGNQALGFCSLDTYDMTPPVGGTHWFPVSSNPYQIRGNLEVGTSMQDFGYYPRCMCSFSPFCD